MKAIIRFPDGEVKIADNVPPQDIEYEEGTVSVKIDGEYYVTSMSNVLLVCPAEEVDGK